MINDDFLNMLDEQVIYDIEEAITSLRHNPGKAIRHLQLARRSLVTILRSAQLVQSRAERIFDVLDSAPADDGDEAA